MSGNPQTYQIRVVLKAITPEIWRRIVVPASYSFWDLHVAIQDAMGWHDSHLHRFTVPRTSSKPPVQIGIPDPYGFEDSPSLPGWDVPLSTYFSKPGDRLAYEYDFGDGWEHEIILEEVANRSERERLPICLDGRRACPPEDCGGAPGYEEMLDALRNPTHEDHHRTLEWVGEEFDPEAFAPAAVHFDEPLERRRRTLDLSGA